MIQSTLGHYNFVPQYLPDQYEQVEYIGLNGSHYIATNFYPDKDSRVILDFSIDSTSNPCCIFGSRDLSKISEDDAYTDTSPNSFAFQVKSASEVRSDSFGDIVNETYSIIGTVRVEKYFNTTNIYKISSSYSLNNAQPVLSYKIGKTIVNNALNNKVNIPLIIGGINDCYSIKYGASIKIYYCEIYSGSKLEHMYIPCFSKVNNIYGLYDKIENNFIPIIGNSAEIKINHVPLYEACPSTKIFTGDSYLNLHKETLPAGYTQQYCLVSNGTHYIDTGIDLLSMMSSYSMELVYTSTTNDIVTGEKFAVFGTQTKESNFSSSQDSSYYGTALYLTGSNKIQYCHTQGYLTKAPNINIKKKTYFNFIGGIANIHQLPYNSYSYSFTPNYNGTNSSGYKLYLFAVNNAGTPLYHSKIKLYRCRLQDNSRNTLKYNFVPCTDSKGVAGLYETVNGQFFKSATARAFSYESKFPYVASSVNKGYIGINGLARPLTNKNYLTYQGTDSNLTASFAGGASLACDDYAIFFGGSTSGYYDDQASANSSTIKITYDLVKSSLDTLRTDIGIYQHSVIKDKYTNNQYLSYSNILDKLDNNLVTTTLYTKTLESQYKTTDAGSCVANVGNYIIRSSAVNVIYDEDHYEAGAISNPSISYNTNTGTISSLKNAINAYSSVANLKDRALFISGAGNSQQLSINKQLVHTSIASITSYLSGVASFNNSCYVVGGGTGQNYDTYSSKFINADQVRQRQVYQGNKNIYYISSDNVVSICNSIDVNFISPSIISTKRYALCTAGCNTTSYGNKNGDKTQFILHANGTKETLTDLENPQSYRMSAKIKDKGIIFGGYVNNAYTNNYANIQMLKE